MLRLLRRLKCWWSGREHWWVYNMPYQHMAAERLCRRCGKVEESGPDGEFA